MGCICEMRVPDCGRTGQPRIEEDCVGAGKGALWVVRSAWRGEDEEEGGVGVEMLYAERHGGCCGGREVSEGEMGVGGNRSVMSRVFEVFSLHVERHERLW